MFKKKIALILVMLMVVSTFTWTFAADTVEVQLPEKEVSEGDDEDFDTVDEWALELYQKISNKYVLIGVYESGKELDLEEGKYKVKEMKFDGYYPYGPSAYTFEVVDDEFIYEDMDEGDVPVFQNVGPFEMVEGFWAMPGEWDEEDEEFNLDENEFTEFGRSWGGYFEFDEFEDEDVPLINGDDKLVGEVELTTTTATFTIELGFEPEDVDAEDYQLLEYQIHFFDEKDMDEKPFKEHNDGEYSVSLGSFEFKSDGFVGFGDMEFAIDHDGEDYVAVHGEIGVPGGDEFDFSDIDFGAIDPEEELDGDLSDGIIEYEGNWKDIEPSERGNKLGHIKKQDPDLYELYKELDKKGGTWKKYRIDED